MSRAVTPSQEELNSMMEEDDMLPPPLPEPSKPEKETKNKLSLPRPKDPRLENKKQISYIPAKELGLEVHAQQTKPFPGSITYDHLKEYIIKDKYNITYTSDKTIEEIKELLKNNQI